MKINWVIDICFSTDILGDIDLTKDPEEFLRESKTHRHDEENHNELVFESPKSEAQRQYLPNYSEDEFMVYKIL